MLRQTIPASRRRRALLRALIAACLAWAMLSSGVHMFGGFASAQVCTMECCAGLAPHPPGSCSHGGAEAACHVDFSKHHEPPPPADDFLAHSSDILCGTSDAVISHNERVRWRKELVRRLTTNPPSALIFNAATGSSAPLSHPDKREPEAAVRGGAGLGQPCLPGCGAGASGASSQRQSREKALLSHAARPRPPTVDERNYDLFIFHFTRAARSHKSSPRAPPSSFTQA